MIFIKSIIRLLIKKYKNFTSKEIVQDLADTVNTQEELQTIIKVIPDNEGGVTINLILNAQVVDYILRYLYKTFK